LILVFTGEVQCVLIAFVFLFYLPVSSLTVALSVGLGQPNVNKVNFCLPF